MISEYADVNSRIFMDEMLAILDVFNDEYGGCIEWSHMSRDDKEKWFRKVFEIVKGGDRSD